MEITPMFNIPHDTVYETLLTSFLEDELGGRKA